MHCVHNGIFWPAPTTSYYHRAVCAPNRNNNHLRVKIVLVTQIENRSTILVEQTIGKAHHLGRIVAKRVCPAQIKIKWAGKTTKGRANTQ